MNVQREFPLWRFGGSNVFRAKLQKMQQDGYPLSWSARSRWWWITECFSVQSDQDIVDGLNEMRIILNASSIRDCNDPYPFDGNFAEYVKYGRRPFWKGAL